MIMFIQAWSMIFSGSKALERSPSVFKGVLPTNAYKKMQNQVSKSLILLDTIGLLWIFVQGNMSYFELKNAMSPKNSTYMITKIWLCFYSGSSPRLLMLRWIYITRRLLILLATFHSRCRSWWRKLWTKLWRTTSMPLWNIFLSTTQFLGRSFLSMYKCIMTCLPSSRCSLKSFKCWSHPMWVARKRWSGSSSRIN